MSPVLVKEAAAQIAAPAGVGAGIGGGHAERDHSTADSSIRVPTPSSVPMAMDAEPQQTWWAIAREHDAAAELCAQQGWHTVSVACSDYAVYTATWVALDNPPHGQWSQAGIMQQFAPGQWRHPPARPERATRAPVRCSGLFGDLRPSSCSRLATQLATRDGKAADLDTEWILS
jgi:hypothetical protein